MTLTKRIGKIPFNRRRSFEGGKFPNEGGNRRGQIKKGAVAPEQQGVRSPAKIRIWAVQLETRFREKSLRWYQ